MYKCFALYVFVVFPLLVGRGCDGLRRLRSTSDRRDGIDGGEPSPEYMKAAEVLARDRRAAAAEEKALIKKEKDQESQQRQHEKEMRLAKAFEQQQKEKDPYFVSNAEVRNIEDMEIKEGEKEQEDEADSEQKLKKEIAEKKKKQKEEALEDRADEKFRQWYLRSNKAHINNNELQ